MDFGIFYANGGVLMHLISLFGLAGLVALGVHIKERKAGAANSVRGLRLAMAFVAGCVAVGALGTVRGFIDASAAVQMGNGDFDVTLALARGANIALVAVAYGLMWAIPLGCAAAMLRFRSEAAPATPVA